MLSTPEWAKEAEALTHEAKHSMGFSVTQLRDSFENEELRSPLQLLAWISTCTFKKLEHILREVPWYSLICISEWKQLHNSAKSKRQEEP